MGIKVFECGAQNPYSLTNIRKAKQMYEQIRRRRTDIINVHNNTGFSLEQCQAIKNYAFVDMHMLHSGYKAFYPDFAMASSWFRLSEKGGNNIQKHDIIMLQHELTELILLLQNTNMNQSTAHKIANSKYNYSDACKLYYKM